jgi:hypothetical protein
MKSISIAKNFTRFPEGRVKGDTSGKAFRERFLEPAILTGEPIEVDLDGTLGYSSSFLDEAFGGLVHVLGTAPDALFALLKIKSEDPQLVEEVRGHVLNAWHRKSA